MAKRKTTQPPRPLTDRQREVLNFICEYIDEKGLPPTLREIGMSMGIRSTNGVLDHLKALLKKGHLVKSGLPLGARGYLPAGHLSQKGKEKIKEVNRPKLTHRQARVLELVEKSVQGKGFAPTVREIGVAMGIKSTNGVKDHLRALEKKGYIKLLKGVCRGIVLV